MNQGVAREGLLPADQIRGREKTMWGLIVIQWLHVFLGIFWFGSTLYLDFVVIAAVTSLPLGQQRTVSKPGLLVRNRLWHHLSDRLSVRWGDLFVRALRRWSSRPASGDISPHGCDETRWNRGARLRHSGPASQTSGATRAARLLRHLHLHDPDALWPLKICRRSQQETTMSVKTLLATSRVSSSAVYAGTKPALLFVSRDTGRP